MKRKVIFVYDDTVKVPENIKTIIGQASYGKIIVKRKSILERVEEIVKEVGENIEMVRIASRDELEKLYVGLDIIDDKTAVFHMFSNFAVKDEKEFKILLEKLPFINETYRISQEKKTCGLVFSQISEYKKFCDFYFYHQKADDGMNLNEIDIDAFCDVSNYTNLLSYISGGFDSRFFNSIEGNEYVITKKSTNKKKIKQEYIYYHLLPDDMKRWMVLPYDYKEDEYTAQYTMERLHMTDIAIRWTHKAIDEEEFKQILNHAFYYINHRASKEVSRSEYEEKERQLYITKVADRIEELKKSEFYPKLDMYIKSGTDFQSIDEIFNLYKELYHNISKKNQKQISVIGHGDLCFANMLYSKETEILKLIDPKGALTEEELWTDPYYDIAKLSHSICGNYDFFNCSCYAIELEQNLKYKLKVYNDNTKFKEIFQEYLKENGFYYDVVRLYEASLFLSMLPLHLDYPHKVFGFLLNAINILEELRKCTKM